MQINDARKALEAAGYHVEMYSSGLYVRETPNSHPTRLGCYGTTHVSNRSVNTLIRKKSKWGVLFSSKR